MTTECKTCGKPNDDTTYRNCSECREFWRLRNRKPNSPLNEIDKLQSKIAKQRNEIARLTQKLEAVTQQLLEARNDR